MLAGLWAELMADGWVGSWAVWLAESLVEMTAVGLVGMKVF